jgi:hypothetical protein
MMHNSTKRLKNQIRTITKNVSVTRHSKKSYSEIFTITIEKKIDYCNYEKIMTIINNFRLETNTRYTFIDYFQNS